MREIVFYKTQRGNCPVEEFLDSLSSRQAKKITWVLQIVETLEMVPVQYFKKLEGTDGLWEVRVDSGSDTIRLLGFMHQGNLVVLTNGFAKKSQKTPVPELNVAERRKKDYLRRSSKK